MNSYFLQEALYFILKIWSFLWIISIIIAFVKGWKPSTVHSHWNQPFKDVQFSTQDIYSKIEQSLWKSGIDNLNITRIELHEGAHFVTPKRYYLRVMWRNLVFDICAAPFGKGFFISWWLFEKEYTWERIVMELPWLGPKIVRAINPITYYKLDTMSMFQGQVHSSVLEVIDTLINEKGISSLSNEERNPENFDLLRR